MNALVTSFFLGIAIVTDVILEIKGRPVPPIITLLVGFAVRHIIGGETAQSNQSTQKVGS